MSSYEGSSLVAEPASAPVDSNAGRDEPEGPSASARGRDADHTRAAWSEACLAAMEANASFFGYAHRYQEWFDTALLLAVAAAACVLLVWALALLSQRA